MAKINFINSFEELSALPKGNKVHRIHSGNISTIIIVGLIPQSKGLIIANNDSLKDVKFIYERDFEENQYTLDYDAKEVGLLMIEQIEKHANHEIEGIRAVYLKDDNAIDGTANLTGEIIHLEDCVWNKDRNRIENNVHYTISTARDYGNSTHSEMPDNLSEAVAIAKIKRKKGDEYDEYWNKQTEVITKITTIREIIRIVKPEEKQ